MHRSIALGTLREQLHLRALRRHGLTSAQHVQGDPHAIRQLRGACEVGARIRGGEIGDRRGEALEAYAGCAGAGVDGDGGGGGGGDLEAVGEGLGDGVSWCLVLLGPIGSLGVGETYRSSTAAQDVTAVVPDVLGRAVDVELAAGGGLIVGDKDGGG